MRVAIIAGLALFISACTPFTQTRDELSAEELWQQRLAQQSQLDSWSFRGRTAIVQGREGLNASLNWEHRSGRYLITLSGPFSQGGARLEGDDLSVTLTLDNGERYQAGTPEQLLAEVMGWKLPVSALHDWVRGIPNATLPIEYKELDPRGRLLKLEQAGWNIDYLEYMPFENTTMPAKVFMKYPELNVRVIIQRWGRPE